AWKLIYSIFAYLAQILTSNPDGACERTQLTRRPWQYRNAVAVSSYSISLRGSFKLFIFLFTIEYCI
ncbi:hypothetical protein QUA30_11755, partial [Microcoleus sp. Pol14C2]|uniref:hypothetical protein n=1 Tax=unclassified Microcoleus TaxID=2642155 RepID=UPI002FCE771C